MRNAASWTVAWAASAVLAMTLAGCGGEDPDAGTNGVGKLAPDKVHARTVRAAEDAASVRLAGRLVTGGGSFKIDMRLNGQGGMGEVTAEGARFELLRVDEHLFLKANDDFWLEQGAGEGKEGEKAAEPSAADIQVAEKLDGKYVKVPKEDSSYKQLRGFTDMDVLLDGLLGLKGELETGDHGEVDGTRTIRLTGSGGEGARLDVSLEGAPVPLRLQRAGDAGELRLVDWDEEFEVHVPRKEDVVDYGRKISAGS